MICFVVVMQSFIMNLHEVFIHIHQGCFAGTGAIVRLPQCQWSKPDGYGKISQCITTTKHSKAKTVCIFLGIYCMGITYTEMAIKEAGMKYRTMWHQTHFNFTFDKRGLKSHHLKNGWHQNINYRKLYSDWKISNFDHRLTAKKIVNFNWLILITDYREDMLCHQ